MLSFSIKQQLTILWKLFKTETRVELSRAELQQQCGDETNLNNNNNNNNNSILKFLNTICDQTHITTRVYSTTFNKL